MFDGGERQEGIHLVGMNLQNMVKRALGIRQFSLCLLACAKDREGVRIVRRLLQDVLCLGFRLRKLAA